MNADLLRLTRTITLDDLTTTLPDPLPVRSSIFCSTQNTTSIIIPAGTALQQPPPAGAFRQGRGKMFMTRMILTVPAWNELFRMKLELTIQLEQRHNLNVSQLSGGSLPMPAKKNVSAENELKTIPVGKKAPAFSLKNAAGKAVKLSDFKGRKLVIYFYPKDLTPGCTTEACAFRDDYPQLQGKGVEVIGVSADDVASHLKFTDKYDLPFQLLSDPDHSMIEKYGAWGEKSMYGKKYFGVIRMTYILDEDARVIHVFPKVKPDGHSREILSALEG